VQVFPAIKIRERHGVVSFDGLDKLRLIVERRGDWKKLLAGEADLERVLLTSGGAIRDLLRLLAEIIRRARSLPVSSQVVEAAINQMRLGFLPIPDDDAVWLAQISETHEASFVTLEKVPDMARFFDTHLVLCYRDGPEWYDVHPLVKEVVLRQAKAIAERRAKASDPPRSPPSVPGS
jgi:hypothetical protein